MTWKNGYGYKGYALYRYGGNENPGDVKGSMRYEFIFNPHLQASLDAASTIATEVRSADHVALIWSHMYP